MHSIFLWLLFHVLYISLSFIPNQMSMCPAVTFDGFLHKKLKRVMKGKNGFFCKCFKLKALWCLTLVFIAINCPKHISLAIKALDKWCVYRELKCSSSWTEVCEPLWNILASFHQSKIFWKRKKAADGETGKSSQHYCANCNDPRDIFFCPPFWDKWFNWKKRKEMILVEDCGSESLAAGRCVG